jgi:hypothetical protein
MTSMTPDQLYEHLENLANQLGISLRHEDLSHGPVRIASGLCKVRGQDCYIMDRSKPLDERIRLLAACLGKMNLDGVYLLPALRSFLREGGAKGKEHTPPEITSPRT